MEFHQMSHDGQAKSQAAEPSVRRTVALAEPLEDVREQVRLNADTTVVDRDFCRRSILLQRQIDVSLPRGEFDGIGEHVPDNLLHTCRIGKHRSHAWLDVGLQRDRLPVSGRAYSVNACAKQGREIDGFNLQPKASGNDLRDLEKIRDELGLQLRVTLDDVQCAIGGGAGQGSVPEHVRPSEDGVQRSSKFMRQHGKKLVLRVVRSLGLISSALCLISELLHPHPGGDQTFVRFTQLSQNLLQIAIVVRSAVLALRACVFGGHARLFSPQSPWRDQYDSFSYTAPPALQLQPSDVAKLSPFLMPMSWLRER